MIKISLGSEKAKCREDKTRQDKTTPERRQYMIRQDNATVKPCLHRTEQDRMRDRTNDLMKEGRAIP